MWQSQKSRPIRKLHTRFHSFWNMQNLKPWPNDRNISTQHLVTLLAQNLQAPAKRSQHFSTTYCNIVGRNMLSAFGHPVATCYDMLGVENRTSAHARAQHCCTNLAKRKQHHPTSTKGAWKIWTVSNLSQQHPTWRNISQQGGQTHATCSPNGVAICCVECCDRLAGALER